MNILFLGAFVPDKFADQIEELSAAGNQFQYNLYCALKKKYEMHAMSYLAIPMDCEKLGMDGELQQEGIELFLPKVRGIRNELLGFRKSLSKWCQWADCILTYNVQYPWLYIGRKKRKILILADYTPADEEVLKKKMYSFLIRKSFNRYQKLVLLSEGARKYVRPNQECVIIPGAIYWEKFQNFKAPEKKEKTTFFYSGVLNHVTGVDILLNAFRKTENEDYELVLCGQGKELEEQIENAVREDHRIRFYGYVSKESYYELLQQADVCVNPRNMYLMQNQYNFPSKVLEYIASGRVIVSTKFKGYQNYMDYAMFCESCSECLLKEMQNAASLNGEKRMKIFAKNREYAQTISWENMSDLFLK